MSKKIKILTPKIYEHGDFFHNAIDFAREHSLNTNELCLELSHYLVDNFDKVWKIEKPRVYKRVADLEAKLAESEKKRQELNDMYEDLLCAKGTEHELKQAKEDVEMLDERRLCLFSLLYETLEKQGCENITSTIEQMTNLHLNKCSHWYKNNRVCDELKQQLAEKETRIAELEDKDWYEGTIKQLEEQNERLIKQLAEKDKEILDVKNWWSYQYNGEIERHNQDKISFAVEKLEKVKVELVNKVSPVNLSYTEYVQEVFNKLNNQIEELKKENVNDKEKS